MREAEDGRAALWAPVVLYGAGIVWLSHQPSLSPPLGLPDWPMHVAEYAGLGALTARALARKLRAAGSATLWSALAACAAFGVLDEWHQSFVPGRHASAADVLADVTGAALALLAGRLLLRAAARRRAVGKIEIRLFGRRGCHLCDEAEKVLDDVCAQSGLANGEVLIQKVDIDTDAELLRMYQDQVPVVTVNGRKLFKHRVEPERLARVLASFSGRR